MAFRTDRLGHIIPAAAFIATLVCVTALFYMKTKADSALHDNQRSFERSILMETQLLDLTRQIAGVEYDILHTQEALEDLSATRGQDGLNDGLSIADQAQRSLMIRADAIRVLSNAMDEPSIAKAISDVQDEYAHFYEQGKVLAQAYVDGGPVAGNKLMPDFDKVADQLQENVGVLNKTVDQRKESVVRETDKVMRELNDQREYFSIIMMSLTAWVFIFCIAGAWLVHTIILRPLTASTFALGQISAGNLEVHPIGLARKDEFGDLARAVAYFRKSEESKRLMEIESEKSKARLEEDKLALQRLAEEEAEAKMAAAMSSIGYGLKQLADGNLSYQISGQIDPRFEQLRSDFNLSTANLSRAIEAVGAASREMNASASGMKEASANLSVRTEQQAVSLEETSAALGQISNSMRETTERTQAALNLSISARENTLSSGDVVDGAIIAMQRIETASREIFTIISVIDEIAFQTNLLALNAGVEAARAGDSGKGFAVVAQEVRELAQRAANAAKEIKTLISKSNLEVASGVELVEATGKALTGIALQVSDIAKNMDLITQSVVEQSNSIQAISGAVTDMDQMTQQNAALVQQTAGVAANLALHAGSMNDQVDRFQLLDQKRDKFKRAS